jgi:hypothetical protein
LIIVEPFVETGGVPLLDVGGDRLVPAVEEFSFHPANVAMLVPERNTFVMKMRPSPA